MKTNNEDQISKKDKIIDIEEPQKAKLIQQSNINPIPQETKNNKINVIIKKYTVNNY